MEKVRAKFSCEEKTETQTGFRLKMYAVYGGDEENDKYFKYTPSGSLVLETINHQAAEMFKPGNYYYIDFIPCE